MGDVRHGPAGRVPAWRAVERTARTGSTNADLLRRAEFGEPEGLVLLADEQTDGRGRRGRSWTSPPGAGIAASVLLRPRVPAARWGWLPLLAGLAVCEALEEACGVAATAKWPNDVLVPDPGTAPARSDVAYRKVAGILVEASGADPVRAAVVGIGINVEQDRADLPGEGATSLRLAGATDRDRQRVTDAVLGALAARYAAWQAVAGDPAVGGLGDAYRARCGTLGQRVRVTLPGGAAGVTAVAGLARAVDDAGRLVLQDAAGSLRPLTAGDVEHVRPVTPDRAAPEPA